MTAVFVNGNPETSAIWDSLLGELERRDTLRLSPPGFRRLSQPALRLGQAGPA